MDGLEEEYATEEPLTDKELADAIRDSLEELNSLRAEMLERGYATRLVGEDGIVIYKDVREEI